MLSWLKKWNALHKKPENSLVNLILILKYLSYLQEEVVNSLLHAGFAA